MRVIAIAAAVTMLSIGSAYAGEQAGGENTCLWNYNIKRTSVSSDERAITFYMKDGKSYVNTLPAQCRGLNLHGFTYVSRTSGEVCAGQGIRLVQSGTVCMLGQFQEAPAKEGSSY